MKLIKIFMVEDSESDIELTNIALQEVKVANKLIVCKQGDRAVQEIRKTKPDLVLLDLNLPGLSGAEILKQLKADAELKSIPVIMLTSSAAEADIIRSYTNGAAAYITKPLKFETFIEMIKALQNFWAAFVKFPS